MWGLNALGVDLAWAYILTKADALKEDQKQNYWLQADKAGDSWLLARDGCSAMDLFSMAGV